MLVDLSFLSCTINGCQITAVLVAASSGNTQGPLLIFIRMNVYIDLSRRFVITQKQQHGVSDLDIKGSFGQVCSEIMTLMNCGRFFLST